MSVIHFPNQNAVREGDGCTVGGFVHVTAEWINQSIARGESLRQYQKDVANLRAFFLAEILGRVERDERERALARFIADLAEASADDPDFVEFVASTIDDIRQRIGIRKDDDR